MLEYMITAPDDVSATFNALWVLRWNFFKLNNLLFELMFLAFTLFSPFSDGMLFDTFPHWWNALFGAAFMNLANNKIGHKNIHIKPSIQNVSWYFSILICLIASNSQSFYVYGFHFHREHKTIKFICMRCRELKTFLPG